MDFSKLSQNEKLAVYGAVAAVLGGIIGGISSLIWIVVLAGLAMLVVLFLPQLSPQTKLPGSRGSLLVVIGGIGAVAAALALLTVLVDIGFWLEFAALRTILFLIGVAGALLMGWVAWQEFQAEGGKFQLGSAATPAAPTTPTTPTGAEPEAPATTSAPTPGEPAAPPPPAASPAPPPDTSPAPPAAPDERDDENRPPV